MVVPHVKIVKILKFYGYVGQPRY